jgi:hypothetical protein
MSWSIAPGGMARVAAMLAAAIAAKTQKTAIGPKKYDVPRAIMAAVALPAWLKASFRPTRREKTFGPTIPSVIAAIAGGKMAPDTCDGLNQCYKRKPRQEGKQEGSCCNQDRSADNDAPLEVGLIDESACRRLSEKTCESGHRHNNADARSIPPLNREQVDGEIRTKPVADVR